MSEPRDHRSSGSHFLIVAAAQKMARVGGHFLDFSVVPMTVTLLNDHGAFPAIFVPAAMQTAVMSIVAVLGSRPAKLTACPMIPTISVHAPVAAYTNAKLLSTGNTRKAYSYRRQRRTSKS
jgi:hypothetical protein